MVADFGMSLDDEPDPYLFDVDESALATIKMYLFMADTDITSGYNLDAPLAREGQLTTH